MSEKLKYKLLILVGLGCFLFLGPFISANYLLENKIGATTLIYYFIIASWLFYILITYLLSKQAK